MSRILQVQRMCVRGGCEGAPSPLRVCLWTGMGRGVQLHVIAYSCGRKGGVKSEGMLLRVGVGVGVGAAGCGGGVGGEDGGSVGSVEGCQCVAIVCDWRVRLCAHECVCVRGCRMSALVHPPRHSLLYCS